MMSLCEIERISSCAVAPRCCNEIERLEFMGKFNSVFRFPQYLANAMLDGAKHNATGCAGLLFFLARIFSTTSFLLSTRNPRSLNINIKLQHALFFLASVLRKEIFL